MAKLMLLYAIFICINFGWGMLATSLIESNEGKVIDNPLDKSYEKGLCFLASGYDVNPQYSPLVNVGEPVCRVAQGCPTGIIEYNPDFHHSLCEVGIAFPDELLYDAKPQSPDVCDGGYTNGLPNDPTCSSLLIQRNVTDFKGNLVDVLVADNGTSINTDESTNWVDNFISDTNESFSFITDVITAGQFAATLLFQTFTGGFILDVLGSGILGVDYPEEFIIGFKILLGLATVSWFYFLFKGQDLIP